MPLIQLQTIINSKMEICFDLSRSIELHQLSTAKTGEVAIDGVTKGLIGPNQWVTWQARHFGIRQKLTTMITAYERPFHFRDEQTAGAFKKMRHDHYFAVHGDSVLMTDEFWFESPLGVLGDLFNRLVLTAYLKKFLVERNRIIKEFAESDRWREVLSVE